jgi:hypothetical protein
MANLTVTAANVLRLDGATVDGIAGAAITAGQVCYYDDTTQTYKLAGAAGTALIADARGIALNNAGIGQPVRILNGGHINPGGTVAVGIIYCVSATLGAIAPSADLASGNYVTILGIGVGVASIALGLVTSGITKA